MDVSMPGIGGIHGDPGDHPQRTLTVAVLLLTMMDDDESDPRRASGRAQRGYVLKGSQPTEILQAQCFRSRAVQKRSPVRRSAAEGSSEGCSQLEVAATQRCRYLS